MKPSNSTMAVLLKEAEDLEQDNRFQDALKVYDLLLKSHPGNPKLWAFRGYCNFCREEYHAALADFDRALEIRDNVPTTLYYRAQVYEKLGKLSNALVDYEKSARLSPEADVYLNIGLIYRYLGNEQASRAAFTEALSIDPENETIRNLLGGSKGDLTVVRLVDAP